MVARTEDEILESLKESLEATDPSVDVRKGPIFDFLLSPVPPELQKTEADAERLTLLSTLQLDEIATEAEIEAMATSFSIRLGGGKPSRTKRQVFFTNTAPTQDRVIERGILVGTEDQSFTYVTSESQTIPAATAENFFNPQTRRYEISVKCEATAVGPDFDLPRTRVSRIITPIDGIDGTTNLDAYDGGEEAEDFEDAVDRVRAKFAGLDPESGGGIISDIRNFDAENVKDVSLVYPKDRELFKRLTNRPAVDAIVLGDQFDEAQQTFISAGGETQIEIENRPVLSVETVQVNGANVPFTLIPDTSLATGGSPRSTDFVLLESALVEADVAIISYTFNLLIFDLQNSLFGQERPFDTDVLAKSPRDIGLEIVVDATVVGTTDTARTFDSIESSLFAQIETDFFTDVLLPEVIRQNIRSDVGGLSELRFTKFKRISGSALEVESVPLAKNSVPIIDQSLLRINVRR